MIKTLGDKLDGHKSLDSGYLAFCPRCNAATSSVYTESEQPTRLGDGCRECRILWKVTKVNGYSVISEQPLMTKKESRTYEIVVTYRPYYIRAANAEEARKKLIRKLRLTGSEPYGIHVRHLMDNAESNEGIAI